MDSFFRRLRSGKIKSAAQVAGFDCTVGLRILLAVLYPQTYCFFRDILQ